MFVVKYSGPFGFIKPWTAVRDGETFSQQFLTQSMLIGIEQKLFPELLGEHTLKKIIRYRLSYDKMDLQQEVTQPRAFSINKKAKIAFRTRAIINRGILINPVLHLAFVEKADAEIASRQHICLARNEDILLPDAEITEFTLAEFDSINGFELLFTHDEESFLVGYNRFQNAAPMHGKLMIYGNPLNSSKYESQ